MQNAYLESLVKAATEGGTEEVAQEVETKGATGAEQGEGKEAANASEELAKMATEDLAGRVMGNAYLAGMRQCGVSVPPKVVLSGMQEDAAVKFAALGVEAVAKRHAEAA